REVLRPQDAPTELHELAIDPLDLGDAGLMDVLRRKVERRVDTDQLAVRLEPPGDVHEAWSVVGAGNRKDVARDRVAVAPERGRCDIGDRLEEGGPEGGEIPV